VSARPAVRIGITGPIGCGKSTISRWLAEHPGVVVVDADDVARAVRSEPEVVSRIQERFGTTDPRQLAEIVFADDAALRDLEAIVHPAVRPRILDAMAEADAEGARAVVIEAIKLVEGGLADLCDEVWLVTCSPGVQRARLIARSTSPEDADRRIAAQGDITARLTPRAMRVIDTSGRPYETRRLVETALMKAFSGAD
jgi:dephospho-CoA kinase